jgi:hypothetical protein
MTAKSGDRILMLGKNKRANPNERAGVVEDVLSDDPPRYVIRWDSGRSTVLAPLPGAIRIEPTKKPASKSASRTTKTAAKSAAKPAAKSSAKPVVKSSTAPKRKTAKA